MEAAHTGVEPGGDTLEDGILAPNEDVMGYLTGGQRVAKMVGIRSPRRSEAPGGRPSRDARG
jgi:hypothetical protein